MTTLFDTKMLISLIWADIKKRIRSWACEHVYEFMGNLHSDFDMALVDKSWWRCPYCKKEKTKRIPYHKDPHTKFVRPMYEGEKAYQHGYMLYLLRRPKSGSYQNDPVLDEQHSLGYQIAEWDEADASGKGATWPVGW